MSVLIKGMKMPKNCFGCHLFELDDRDLWCIANHYAGYCRVLSKHIDENKFVNERHPDCPLIEVPIPHGRLGDLDALKAQYKYGEADSEDERLWMMNIRSAITNAPTVIETEGETDGR